MRRSPAVAFLLQCLPLLSAGSCIAAGLDDHIANPEISPLLLTFQAFLLFSGAGYFYLARRARFWLLTVLGPVAGLLLYVFVQIYFNVLYGAPLFTLESPQPPHVRAAVDSALIVTGLLLAAGALALAVDAGRLAAKKTVWKSEQREE